MKKSITILLLLCSLGLFSQTAWQMDISDTSKTTVDYREFEGKKKAHYYAKEINLKVDGKFDEWSGSNIILMNQPKDGTIVPPPPEDFSGYIMIGWNKDKPGQLFMAGEFVDDILQDNTKEEADFWRDDCIEFLVDFLNEQTSGSVLKHGVSTAGTDFTGAFSPDNSEIIVINEGNKYIVELYIDYSKDNPFMPGRGTDFVAKQAMGIGMTIAFDDAEGGGRQSQMGWTPGRTWDPNNWGIIVFTNDGKSIANVEYSKPEILVLDVPPSPIPTPKNTKLSKKSYFVSPWGNDKDKGSEKKPFKTLEKALTKVKAGYSIVLRGGVHKYHTPVYIEKSGKKGSPITLIGYPGEVPILDFGHQAEGGSSRGLELMGDYWELKNIVVQRAGDNGIHISGSNNLIDTCVFRQNKDSGLQIGSGSSNNLVINSDSYYNYDPGNHGQNADGFAAKFDIGPGNAFKNCRAWNNADDGWDFWHAGEGVLVENCISLGHGFNFWQDDEFVGNGNGFKLGKLGGAHILKNCISAENNAHGIDVNGNTSGVKIINCTAYANNGVNFQFDSDLPHELTNNFSIKGRLNIFKSIKLTNNSWQKVEVLGDEDFKDIDTIILKSMRNSDGTYNLNNIFIPVSELKMDNLGARAK